ncbi:MAG: LacI family DNA-binding transcriptional regulator [bacterium]
MANVTMEDVARCAGVSRDTVSRVLKNLHEGTSFPIAEDTRSRVLQAIEELDYHPHFVATSLASGKARTVGFLFPGNALRDWFLVEVCKSATEYLSERNYNMLIPVLKPGEDLAHVARSLIRSQRVDGVLVCLADLDEPWNRLCLEDGYRITFVGSSVPEGKAAHVAADDRQGGCLATSHLMDSGYRQIAFIGSLSWPNVRERHAGYKQVFSDRSMPLNEAWTVDVSRQDLSLFDLRAVVERLVNGESPVRAMFVASDALAIRILKAALDLGISVPEQLAIMGFDDIWPSAYVSPSLSTVRQDASQIGRRAAEVLLEGLDRQVSTNQTVLIPPELVPRDTT